MIHTDGAEIGGGVAENASAVIGIEQMRQRFGLGPRQARALMRRMRHVEDGGRIWTREAWLAEWMAANAIPGSDWPALDRDRDPMDEDVVQRAVELVGMLAERGAVKICAVQ